MNLKIMPSFYDSTSGPTGVHSIIQDDEQENENWRRLHLQTQTRPSPTFHKESVCLCGVSLGFDTSKFMCIFSGLCF